MDKRDAELEIVLSWVRDRDEFNVGLAYDDPSDAADRRDYVDAPLRLDTEGLSSLLAQEEQYGLVLGEQLLAEGKIRSFYDRAMATARDRGIPLHLRLVIDPRAPVRYHSIRWESIRDPVDGLPIATQRQVLLSRYLASQDWRKVCPPPWHRLRALIVIASPDDLSDKDRVGRPEIPLYPVDVEGELQRARQALKDMERIELVGRGGPTLERIIEKLDEEIDVLYLVCHGGLYREGPDRQEPRLYLEDDEGCTRVVSGGLLAEKIGELGRPPTIAVLCSCQSAGHGDEALASDDGALASLGPRLAASGVAAVVGMQGNITMTTAAMFLPAFFDELARHGLVDQAMATARGRVRGRCRDWWMPVLFTRLRRGRAWYQPEFGAHADTTFRALISTIRAGRCTPVLGSGIAGESIIPSREQLAQSWADQWLMPLAAQNRVDLAKVAQYLAVRTAPRIAQLEVGQYLASELRSKYAEQLPERLRSSENPAELLREVGVLARRRGGDQDAYRILASLRCPVYITTSWTGLLEDAIKAEGREPIVRYFDWHHQRRDEHDVPEPDRDTPLVYHLFGSIEEPESLVVSEDNYFAWLTAWIKRVDKDVSIPGCVGEALTNRSLLFLGYSLDEWEFRVLFHAIKSFGGTSLLRDNLHVGVQISPEGTTLEPEAVQEYLEHYLSDEKVNIYWGRCERFLRELSSRITGRP